MQSFPLFESLSKLADDKKEFNLVEICTKISKLNDEQQENIAAFIYHYSLLEKIKLKKNTIPYNGKTINDSKIGVMFTFSNLPEQLQQIISYYVTSL